MVVQTLNPDHFCFAAASRHDYDAFFASEIEERREVSYPPFTRLCSVRLDGVSEAKVTTAAARLKRKAERLVHSDKRFGDVRVLGPAPALVAKVRGRYRWHFLIKEREAGRLVPFVAELKSWMESAPQSGVRLTIDMDPITTV